jgi:predicted nuclease with TOPRIM domain
MRTGRSLIVVLVASGVLAGCGGELSEQELRDQANQACREYAEKVESLESPDSPDALGSAVEEAQPVIDDLRSDLDDLRPPAALEERYEEFVQGVENAGNRLSELGEAAEDEDTERLQRLVGEAAEAQQGADQAAQELGLDECD